MPSGGCVNNGSWYSMQNLDIALEITDSNEWKTLPEKSPLPRGDRLCLKSIPALSYNKGICWANRSVPQNEAIGSAPSFNYVRNWCKLSMNH